mmetsp:Transcript_27543/g.88964  ORF Transcript_27543/g.88964 Transcript_27543/m.88964 type:complete len:217 (+) Transcript_27543:838-1488(+)
MRRALARASDAGLSALLRLAARGCSTASAGPGTSLCAAEMSPAIFRFGRFGSGDPSRPADCLSGLGFTVAFFTAAVALGPSWLAAPDTSTARALARCGAWAGGSSIEISVRMSSLQTSCPPPLDRLAGEPANEAEGESGVRVTGWSASGSNLAPICQPSREAHSPHRRLRSAARNSRPSSRSNSPASWPSSSDSTRSDAVRSRSRSAAAAASASNA